jgi:hypothetical protein
MLTDFFKYVVSFFDKGGSSEIHPVKDTEIFEPNLDPIEEEDPIKEAVEVDEPIKEAVEVDEPIEEAAEVEELSKEDLIKEEDEKRAEHELEHCFLTFF